MFYMIYINTGVIYPVSMCNVFNDKCMVFF